MVRRLGGPLARIPHSSRSDGTMGVCRAQLGAPYPVP